MLCIHSTGLDGLPHTLTASCELWSGVEVKVMRSWAMDADKILLTASALLLVGKIKTFCTCNMAAMLSISSEQPN